MIIDAIVLLEHNPSNTCTNKASLSLYPSQPPPDIDNGRPTKEGIVF